MRSFIFLFTTGQTYIHAYLPCVILFPHDTLVSLPRSFDSGASSCVTSFQCPHPLAILYTCCTRRLPNFRKMLFSSSQFLSRVNLLLTHLHYNSSSTLIYSNNTVRNALDFVLVETVHSIPPAVRVPRCRTRET